MTTEEKSRDNYSIIKIKNWIKHLKTFKTFKMVTTNDNNRGKEKIRTTIPENRGKSYKLKEQKCDTKNRSWKLDKEIQYTISKNNSKVYEIINFWMHRDIMIKDSRGRRVMRGGLWGGDWRWVVYTRESPREALDLLSPMPSTCLCLRLPFGEYLLALGQRPPFFYMTCSQSWL